MRRISEKFSQWFPYNSNKSQPSSLTTNLKNSQKKKSKKKKSQSVKVKKVRKYHQHKKKKVKRVNKRRRNSIHPSSNGPSLTEGPRIFHSSSETTRALLATPKKDRLNPSTEPPRKRTSLRLWMNSASACVTRETLETSTSKLSSPRPRSEHSEPKE